jgi:GNAT superfamily N-acetyltransferase
MKIRNYLPSDKEEIKEMVSELLESIFNGDGHEFKILREFSVKKNYILFLVGVIDGKIVGTIALKKENKNIVRLKRMYVRKEYEGRGIAQKMLEEAVSFAKKSGCKKMLFSIYPVMTNAKRFTNKNDFVECKGDDPEQLHFVKEL